LKEFRGAKNPWRTLNQRWVYTNPWIHVREDSVIRPGGSSGVYSVVVMPPSVGVVAVDDNGLVALVKQWRYTLDRLSLEVPTGGLNDDELDPDGALRGAQRELQEETGLQSDLWQFLGTIDNSNGVTNEVAHLFLATGVTRVVEWTADPDEPLTVVWVEWEEAVRRAVSSEITESVSVCALLRADLRRKDRA